MSNDKEDGLKFYKDLSIDKSQNDNEIKKVYQDWAYQYDKDNDDLLGTVSQPNSVNLLNNHTNDKNIEIVEALELPPIKIHCSVLAEDSIRQAIEDYESKQ